MDDFQQEVAKQFVDKTAGNAYSDLIQPTAKSIGNTLSLFPRTIGVWLGKWEKWIINGEKSIELTKQAVQEKLVRIPEEKLSEPEPNIAIPAIQQLSYCYDCEELRYSLRSILEYIPWVRKIFIVMPNEKVKFLKPYDEIKDRIVYVKDKDLLGYDTANIFAFSFNLHKMEKFGISKNFIYMEDDFFFGKPLEKKDFFYYDEKESKVFPFVVNNLYSEINVKQRILFYYYLDKKREKIKVHGHRGWVYSVLGTDKYFI